MTDQSLTSLPYEFTPAQNQTIGGLAGRMKILGWAYIAQGLLTGLLGFLALVVLPLAGVVYLIITTVVLLSGIWTRSASTSFLMIVTTRGSDISHLMDALAALRKLYGLQVWLLAGALVLIALAVLAALFFGIDAVPTMEQSKAT
jgi:hypothetical protein